MNKKNIQILVVIICFAGAGFVLYKGFGGSSVTVPVSSGPAGASVGTASDGKVLPFGDGLPIEETLGKYGFQFGAYTYPKLDPGAEVGVDLKDLFQPEVINEAAGGNSPAAGR